MKIVKVIQMSARQLLINKTKSIFAVVGLSIGIASVITMVAIGDGAKKAALSQLEQSGSNLIVVNAGKITKVMERRQNSDIVTTLRLTDSDSIITRCPSVKEAVPAMEKNMNVKYKNINTKGLVHGVTVPYFSLKNFEIAAGNLFSKEDEINCERVGVLGGQVSETLFGTENPVGKTILVNKIPFLVKGVLKNKGISADGANLDVQVLIPINTALRRVFNQNYLKRIFIEVTSKEDLQPAEKEIVATLRKNHRLDLLGKENDFTIENQLTALQSIESSSQSFTWLITGVAAIAILVGGIGILAVMLLSVKERISEIGLRISVGAKRKDISFQFLAESGILGITGGLAGLITGIIISLSVKAFTDWEIAITAAPIIISFAFSIITGLLSGVLPAGKASAADPISALQKE